MSTISVRQSHNKTPEELRDLIRQLAIKLEDKYQLKSTWLNDDEVEVQRSGVKGRISLRPAEVKVDIKLGLMMGALKSTIQREISRSMAEKLG
ncbi:polyhydroxyalkanoic acid system family protein [Zhongshania sp.]|uniref:polyhydroxyalkanoic acid system family protein n=1 Tax=Zhongshania sp. TaxID=1971902 RepID=UPI0035649166